MKKNPVKTPASIEEGVVVKVNGKNRKTELILPPTVDENGKIDYSALRLLARITFVTSPDTLTTEQLHEKDPFNQIALNTLSVWRAADKWQEARISYKNQLESRILTKLAESQSNSILKQLDRMDGIAEKLYSLIEDEFVPPKSLEGMVAALVKLEKFRLEARSTAGNLIAAELTTKEQRINGQQGPTPKYPTEILRTVARNMIKADMEHAKAKKMDEAGGDDPA